VESQNKKATFLKEVIRALGLIDIQVHQGRAEDSVLKAQTVTMRAVERFEVSASAAATLVEPGGRLALLIGAPQVNKAQSLLPDFQWQPAIEIPQSEQRVLLLGGRQ
ncbi:MAG TPA: RsmG family class I SAM-dependent methyltransferase, partial [Terriglobales bacterium]